MRLGLKSLVLLTLAGASCAPTGTTYLGFSVGVVDAPPPPRIVFVGEPAVVVATGTSVYVVTSTPVDCDMFRYGSSWYVYYQGFWYRSRSVSGPYAVLDVRYVPRAVVSLPAEHWRHRPHGGPPGLAKKRGGRV